MGECFRMNADHKNKNYKLSGGEANDMPQNTMDAPRKIIEDFAKEISAGKMKDGRSRANRKTIIPFRQDQQDRIERDIWKIRTDLLRFRKDNGRIASDVESYEKLNQPLREDENSTQKILEGFLESKDREKTEELVRSLAHTGQTDPAIITCDGFLINGNRRKLALNKLYKETQNDKHCWMRVVILPGKDDPGEGGPPTILEIEQVENRCQLQREGKAEYHGFDRALSMRRKIKNGMSLEAQLRDDPVYANLPEKEFRRAVTKFQKEYLNPLEAADEYLGAIGRPRVYGLISQGSNDSEGRWQAFIDYSSKLAKKLNDGDQRFKMGVADNEVGRVKDIAFKVIRQRSFPGMSKLHMIMRKLPDLLANPDSKEELFALSEIDMGPKSGVDEKSQDKEWSKQHASNVINRVKRAVRALERKTELEEPIETLTDIRNQIGQDGLEAENLLRTDLPQARRLAEEIRNIADDLKSGYYRREKASSPGKLKKVLRGGPESNIVHGN